MPRKRGGLFGSPFGVVPKKQSEAPPAARRPDLENILCAAIQQRTRVALRYEDDLAARTFDPYAVFWSSKRKVCVSGMQISNPSKPMDRLEPHIFEVGKIRTLSLTDEMFSVDPRFDRGDRKYRGGIICAV